MCSTWWRCVVERIFFRTPEDFRSWLAENHERESEILVGFYKTSTGKPSITWSESVDEALCFGWIDGVRRRLDDESYTIRFTPRKPGSIWSDRNIKRVEELTTHGRMQPAGLRAFEARSEERSRIYSFEQDGVAFSPEYEERLREHVAAWEFFQSQAPWYRKAATHWVMSAKREATRESRLKQLIDDSASGRTIRPLTRNTK
jgi:uncharacterized protein YdeI (YjbR/CyaY-like superfamily)